MLIYSYLAGAAESLIIARECLALNLLLALLTLLIRLRTVQTVNSLVTF